MVLRGWLNKECTKCWPASHAFHFSFCKIAQSKGRALRQDYLTVVLKGWFNKEKRKCRILRILYFLFLKIYSRPCSKKIVKFNSISKLNTNGSLDIFFRNKKCRFFKRHFLISLLRGQDSNLRPLGYEPNELPLLHPAIFWDCKYTVLY